ncbi:unnamed protein product [Ambrosiozyma monospora]|uniref:Unnamed protein product n=1 Tax=Ambrosiozyma monospora TaxID=43982 RepID=A0A9W6Z2M3_AMBMO|nr:unnamed protein product [Ambrosiozyma monospora]
MSSELTTNSDNKSTSEQTQKPKPNSKPKPKQKRTRSRTGCHACKKAKIKCDETKPTCLNCARVNRQCDYSLKLTWGGRPYKKPKVEKLNPVANLSRMQLSQNGNGNQDNGQFGVLFFVNAQIKKELSPSISNPPSTLVTQASQTSQPLVMSSSPSTYLSPSSNLQFLLQMRNQCSSVSATPSDVRTVIPNNSPKPETLHHHEIMNHHQPQQQNEKPFKIFKLPKNPLLKSIIPKSSKGEEVFTNSEISHIVNDKPSNNAKTTSEKHQHEQQIFLKSSPGLSPLFHNDDLLTNIQSVSNAIGNVLHDNSIKTTNHHSWSVLNELDDEHGFSLEERLDKMVSNDQIDTHPINTTTNQTHTGVNEHTFNPDVEAFEEYADDLMQLDVFQPKLANCLYSAPLIHHNTPPKPSNSPLKIRNPFDEDSDESGLEQFLNAATRCVSKRTSHNYEVVPNSIPRACLFLLMFRSIKTTRSKLFFQSWP